MRIAISATGKSLDAPMDDRFGRCPFFFVISDLEGAEPEVVDNPHAQRGSGAGIQAARMLIDRGVSVVLTGRCGPNSLDTLAAAGVDVMTGFGGTVRNAMERYAAIRSETPTGGGTQETVAGRSPATGEATGRGAGFGMGGGSRWRRGSGLGAGKAPKN